MTGSWEGWGKGSVPAGQGNYTIYSTTVQYRETALLWTPIEASVLINYNRGILTMYGKVDHVTYSSQYYFLDPSCNKYYNLIGPN